MRAGAASLPLEPPLGLPMVGFVRQRHGALGYGGCRSRRRRSRSSAATRASSSAASTSSASASRRSAAARPRRRGDRGRSRRRAAELEPHAPRADRRRAHGADLRRRGRRAATQRVRRVRRVIQDKIVSVCRLAVERLEPAGVVWGVGEADVAVNRRERAGRRRTILGWNPDELVDTQVTTLQAAPAGRVGDRDARRLRLPPGHDRLRHVRLLGRLPRAAARRRPRGRPAASASSSRAPAGNVLPRSRSPTTSGRPSGWGRRLAVAALDSVADRLATPAELVRGSRRLRDADLGLPREREAADDAGRSPRRASGVDFPLLPLPPLEEVARLRAEYGPQLEAARRGGDRGKVKVAYYHATGRAGPRRALAGTAPHRRSTGRSTRSGSATA